MKVRVCPFTDLESERNLCLFPQGDGSYNCYFREQTNILTLPQKLREACKTYSLRTFLKVK